MMKNFESIEHAIRDLRDGKIILVTDDETRENEGDLICAAEFATTENVNFMATHAKGLICTPMSEEIAKSLDFSQMVTNNTDNHSTAFTVSIDHVDTTTGISAKERGLTARMIVSDGIKPEDFRRPGHMFPLIAKKYGVLERGGHTEATVDLLKLAGLKECGLCVEIMREDGTMMRLTELKEFAKKHNITITSVKTLQEYRKYHENHMKLEASANLPTKYGDFTIKGYIDEITGEEHVALVMGDFSNDEPVLCRIHSECLTGDVFGSLKCDCGQQLDAALQQISEKGRGILVYLRQEGRGIGLVNKIKAYSLQDSGMDTIEANRALGFDDDLRDYYPAAGILKNLGVNKVGLITNNPDKMAQLSQYGIEITDRVAHSIKTSKYAAAYLETKKEKMGHLL